MKEPTGPDIALGTVIVIMIALLILCVTGLWYKLNDQYDKEGEQVLINGLRHLKVR